MKNGFPYFRICGNNFKIFFFRFRQKNIRVSALPLRKFRILILRKNLYFLTNFRLRIRKKFRILFSRFSDTLLLLPEFFFLVKEVRLSVVFVGPSEWSPEGLQSERISIFDTVFLLDVFLIL